MPPLATVSRPFLNSNKAGGLFDEAVRAGLEHLADQHGILVAGEDEHPHVRELLADAAEDIDAVQAGQLGVEDEQVGLDLEAEGDGAWPSPASPTSS